jgi:hypothetical protein
VIDSISVENPLEAQKPLNPSQMVLVECDGVRYVVNQDQAGKWRTLSSRRELKGVIEVIEVVR